MFCPPGSRMRTNARSNRRQLKHLHGIEQAIGQVWSEVRDGEESSDEDDIPVTSRHYAHERSGPDASPHVTATSLGSLQLFTPEHVVSRRTVSSPHATATSGSSDADEDEESLAESLPQDGTALADTPELHTLLNDLLLQSSTKPKPSRLALDPTETETTMDEEEDDFFPNMMPAALRTRLRHDDGSTSDSDMDNESDADSLDLGVPATVWSNKGRSNFLSSTTNKAAMLEIAQLSMVPSNTVTTTPNGMNISLESNDDTDDEQHAGGELFMLAEGMRYSRPGEPPKQEVSPTKERPADPLPTVDSCFGGIQLLTPTFFTSAEPATKVPVAVTPQVEATLTSPLASIVHHMDLQLFDKAKKTTQKETNVPATPGNDVATPSPVKGMPLSVLQSDHIELDTEHRRANLSSSFKSSTKSNRVAYNLSSGKKSMSKIERVYSKSFLPRQRLVCPSATAEITIYTSHGSLSVLLADIRSKIFEIVSCDVGRETTVGDVLSKARSMATDPALSEQKYISFCYGTQEFGAPMLPVSVLIDWNKHKTRPLVVAVPMGSTAAEMQSVKRVLWKNPKLKEWWGQQDPFQPTPTKQRPSRRSGTKKSLV